MKAIAYDHYGSSAVLRCEDIDKPAPADDELLIKVRAASINPFDWHFMRGTPYPIRMMTGLRKPKDTRLGVDMAGEVEAVGRNVTKFKPGDRVFGGCRGAFAEYASAKESGLALKPDRVTFEQAAAVNIAALTALQGLRDKGAIQRGQKVLINGAAGGVGTFAVQIAKSFDTDVTGVCSTRNVEMVRSIGANQVVDYTQEDFTNGGQRYDLMLDCVGNHSLSACMGVLNPQGIYVMVGGQDGRWLGALARFFNVLVSARFARRKLTAVGTRGNPADLDVMRELMKSGKVTPVIDRQYRLSETAAAIQYVEQGHARGKVVIAM